VNQENTPISLFWEICAVGHGMSQRLGTRVILRALMDITGTGPLVLPDSTFMS